MRQCLDYVFTSDRKIEHRSASSSDDPTASGDNHGDLVVADMLACLCLDKELPKKVEESRAPQSSVFYRLQQTRRANAMKRSVAKTW